MFAIIESTNIYADTTVDSIKKVVAQQMVYVDGGTFKMGQTNALTETTVKPLVPSTTSDDDSPRPEELPVHTVTVSDFFISKYEVTQELWVAVMGSNPCYLEESTSQSKEPAGLLPIIPNNSQVIRTQYYSLDGKEMPYPTSRSLYIRKQTLSNGKVVTTKCYSK